MKTKNKNIILLAALLILLISTRPVTATSLNFINVDVDMLKNGDANISMVWDYYDDEGTEHFIPINVSQIDLSNFQVSRNGQAYEYIGEWDIDASFDEKAGKCGIVDYGDSYELCWGISEYGENQFTVSYKIHNIVQYLEDAQAINHQFINDDLSDSPESVKISIRGFEEFSEEEIRMWGFGFEGEIFLEEGIVNARSNSPFSSSNYANIMLRFPKGYFDNPEGASRNMTFEEFQNIAFEGSDYEYYDEEGNIIPQEEINQDSGDILGFLLIIISSFGLFLFSVLRLNKLYSKEIDINPKDYKGQYYRNIPYNQDSQLEDIYFILNKLKMSDYSDYMNYYFLKWIKNEALVKTNYEKGIFFKKQKDGLQIVGKPEFDHSLEEMFFGFLEEAAGTDMMLEEDEFNKWMSKNGQRFKSFIDDLTVYSEEKLLDDNYLELEKRRFLFLSNRAPVLSDKGIELTENLIKFKNYLYDFSLLNERDSMNVHLWDELMLYAAILGITDRVQKEFSKLSPEYFENTNYDISAIQLSYLYSRSINNSYRAAMDASSFGASSGFGGGTSIGGGGGFSGGGSGGGTR